MEGSHVSKAFLRSQKMPMVCFFLLRASVTLLIKCTMGCEVEWPPLKPNCHFVKMLLLSRNVSSLKATIFSIILEKELKSEMGL